MAANWELGLNKGKADRFIYPSKGSPPCEQAFTEKGRKDLQGSQKTSDKHLLQRLRAMLT